MTAPAKPTTSDYAAGPLACLRDRPARSASGPVIRNTRPGAVWIAAALIAVAALPAHAEDTARKTNDVLSSVAGIAQNLELADVPSPINITADRLEFLYGQGVLRYQGNVTVDHAGAKIRAQNLEVSFEPEGKRSLRKITAKGGVEVTRGDESARGELAEYDPVAGTITLSQNAKLGSGPNSVAGEKVVVYLNERRAVVLGGAAPPASAGTNAPVAAAGTPPATGSGRIKAVFMPDALEKHDGGGHGDDKPKAGDKADKPAAPVEKEPAKK